MSHEKRPICDCDPYADMVTCPCSCHEPMAIVEGGPLPDVTSITTEQGE